MSHHCETVYPKPLKYPATIKLSLKWGGSLKSSTRIQHLIQGFVTLPLSLITVISGIMGQTIQVGGMGMCQVMTAPSLSPSLTHSLDHTFYLPGSLIPVSFPNSLFLSYIYINNIIEQTSSFRIVLCVFITISVSLSLLFPGSKNVNISSTGWYILSLQNQF